MWRSERRSTQCSGSHEVPHVHHQGVGYQTSGARLLRDDVSISWGAALAAIGGSGGMRGTTPGSDPRFAYALIAMLAGRA
jgi:hypothetical protein